jgi:hypothetical protein
MKDILTAATGIICMTAFSYVYSWLRKKTFREPELLNELLSRLGLLSQNNVKKHPAGWIIHYLVGVLFVVAYGYIFRATHLDPTLLTYAGFGFVSGIIGIIGWKITFGIHPRPPEIHFSEYYLHLLIAHVIFGMGVWLGYRLIGEM